MKHFSIYLAAVVTSATLVAADISIKPYTQWTFDTAIEQVVFLENVPGYPIYMIRTKNFVRIYDDTGEEIRKIERLEYDKFYLNNARTGFMLVHEQELMDSRRDEKLSSFQVFTSKGERDYTSVYKSDFNTGDLRYQLTDNRSIIITEEGKPWLLKQNAEDTLLFLPSIGAQFHSNCEPLVLAVNLGSESKMVTAAGCAPLDSLDKPTVELKLWADDKVIATLDKIEGELTGLRNIPKSDYYFLEMDHGDESSLTLFSGTNALVTYPWRSWEIRALDQREAFVISEKDFNIVNLGDGSVANSYHPIELRGISDAAYMQDWGIYLYLRYVLFFTKDGKQAFRNFVLEGVDHSGQLVHRSSFGTWSTVLPKISPVGRDKFAIHIHNAVLLYDIEQK